MLLHPIDTVGGEIIPSGAMIFTPLELTVIALARSEKGRVLGTPGRLVQALFTLDQRLKRGRWKWTLADARLEALREFVNSLYRQGRGPSVAAQTLEAEGFSTTQVTWLRSECAHPL